jgi:8-oxo-dGTP pyrophosphatase MutT (NUDIX family)
MIEVRDLVTLVEDFIPESDRGARTSRDRTLSLLRTAQWPLDRRSFSTGHITTSGLVLSPDREQVLLIFHPRLRRWIQPGGHIETNDTDIVSAARREVREETGVVLDETVEARLVGVEVHHIPVSASEPGHVHHDLIFGFVARDQAAAPVEGMRAAWYLCDTLDEFTRDAALRRAALRAREVCRRRTSRSQDSSPVLR